MILLQKCKDLPLETFNFDLESNGVPYEADMVSFIVGRHETGDDEAMEPFYHDKSAAISQIIFETTVGRRLLAIHKKLSLNRILFARLSGLPC